ncbi:40S ribosomal protein S3a [Manis javanica]|nr:40S ribosomal protein S3a [Manis javanica]
MKKCNSQIRKISSAQHQKVLQIWKDNMEIMTQEVQTNGLKEMVNRLTPDSMGKDREKACQSIYQLHDVFVPKVKILEKPSLNWKTSWSFMMKIVVLEKLLGMRQLFKLNELMDTSHQSKNLFKIRTFHCVK